MTTSVAVSEAVAVSVTVTGVLDAGVLDAGVLDAGVLDAGVLDAGVLDAGVLEPPTSGSLHPFARICAPVNPLKRVVRFLPG